MKKGVIWVKNFERGHSTTKIHDICVSIHELTSLEVTSDQIFVKFEEK